MLHNLSISNRSMVKYKSRPMPTYKCICVIKFTNIYGIYTIEDLKRHVFNLQWSGIGNDLKQSTPTGCGFKSSPV